MIDPASNLEGTQTRMNDWVKKAFPQWSGVVGKEPDAADALKQVRSQVQNLTCMLRLRQEDLARSIFSTDFAIIPPSS